VRPLVFICSGRLLTTCRLLTKLGCVVHTAKDGRECVDMVLNANAHTYDLICLDNFMPVMTGEEAVKEIRSHERDDFVVGCTGASLLHRLCAAAD
jgi:CheY-like chemotaxis protein